MRILLLFLASISLAQAQRFVDVETTELKVKDLAELWNITPQEYERFLLLKQGPAGAFATKNLSPYELLGYYAETSADRERWANRYLAMVATYTRRHSLFREAVKTVRFPRKKEMSYKLGDRLLLLVDTHCIERCDQVLKKVLRKLEQEPILGLDLFFDPGTSEAKMLAFAAAKKLPVDWVNDKRITLAPAHEDERRLFDRAPHLLLYGADKSITDLGGGLEL